MLYNQLEPDFAAYPQRFGPVRELLPIGLERFFDRRKRIRGRTCTFLCGSKTPSPIKL
jgi:hypothetical protein